MKLQGLGIIFALIVLPIILVMSYYIQLEVDTLSLQKSYDSKLLDSTYDAMSAFEINTANEDLSTVSDSLRTIVEASSNVFITTLATNLGMNSVWKYMRFLCLVHIARLLGSGFWGKFVDEMFSVICY